jgi:hypothetical protein
VTWGILSAIVRVEIICHYPQPSLGVLKLRFLAKILSFVLAKVIQIEGFIGQRCQPILYKPEARARADVSPRSRFGLVKNGIHFGVFSFLHE